MDQATKEQLDRLDQATENLLAELAGYSEAELNNQPRPGSWSAVQVLHHLILTETLALKYLRKKLSFEPKLEPAGWKEKAREWFLALYFRTGLKRRAPANISGDQLPQEATLAATSAEWRALRQEYRAYLSSLGPTLFEKSVFNHPIVGRLSLSGMLYFHYLHFRHHRKQVRAAVPFDQARSTAGR